MNHSASHKGHTYKITHEAHKWGNCMAGKSCGFGERLKINFINLINFFLLFENIWIFSEETEGEPDLPMYCKDVKNPCTFPGCEDMSCEEFCSIDETCVNHWLLDKKCCECKLCKDYDPEEETTTSN